MAWRVARVWAPAEVVTAANMNFYISQILNYLQGVGQASTDLDAPAMTLNTVPVVTTTGTQTLSNKTLNVGTLVTGGAGALKFGVNPAQGQYLDLPNSQGIGWRNAANTADLLIGFDNIDRLNIIQGGPNLVAVGGAPALDLLVNINGSQFRIGLKQ